MRPKFYRSLAALAVQLPIIVFLAAKPLAAQTHTFADVESASIKALGGMKAVQQIRSIRALADCTGPNGRYTTEIHSARGNRLSFKQVREDRQTFIAMVNGKIAWTKKTNDEFDWLDKAGVSMIRSHEFQMIPLTLAERYTNFVVEGEAEYAGQPCVKIRALDELGKPFHLFFNSQTKLLAGMILPDVRSDTGEVVKVVFNTWKTIGTLKLPVKVTATDRAGEFVLNFHSIILNHVDEKMFKIPVTVLALAELVKAHEQARAAHFNKDAAMMVAGLADDHINVTAGKINRPTIAENLKRFQNYFGRVEFLEWDDVVPPIYRVSKDATMAYVIVQKRVRLKTRDEQVNAIEESTVFAWIEIHEKKNGKWILKAVASTNEPPSH
jgi:hypothetical protein